MWGSEAGEKGLSFFRELPAVLALFTSYTVSSSLIVHTLLRAGNPGSDGRAAASSRAWVLWDPRGLRFDDWDPRTLALPSPDVLSVSPQ